MRLRTGRAIGGAWFLEFAVGRLQFQFCRRWWIGAGRRFGPFSWTWSK